MIEREGIGIKALFFGVSVSFVLCFVHCFVFVLGVGGCGGVGVGLWGWVWSGYGVRG